MLPATCSARVHQEACKAGAWRLQAAAVRVGCCAGEGVALLTPALTRQQLPTKLLPTAPCLRLSPADSCPPNSCPSLWMSTSAFSWARLQRSGTLAVGACKRVPGDSFQPASRPRAKGETSRHPTCQPAAHHRAAQCTGSGRRSCSHQRSGRAGAARPAPPEQRCVAVPQNPVKHPGNGVGDGCGEEHEQLWAVGRGRACRWAGWPAWSARRGSLLAPRHLFLHPVGSALPPGLLHCGPEALRRAWLQGPPAQTARSRRQSAGRSASRLPAG